MFNIGHENVKKCGYHGDIHIQTADSIKDNLLAIDDITPMTDKYWDSYIMGVTMTQYSLKAGLNKFGDSYEEAIVK